MRSADNELCEKKPELSKMEIWKYPLGNGSPQMVSMPKGAEILTVQVQAGHTCLWAHVDPNEELEPRKIYIVGTGHPTPADAWRYIGTIQQPPFVWHIFEGD